MSDTDPKSVKTGHSVSQVLAAHAAAQISAARQRDKAAADIAPKPEGAHCISFTVGWAEAAMCIGFKKPCPG